ncbi:hypothetical protein Tco_0079349 [Tanacetum coccineum]
METKDTSSCSKSEEQERQRMHKQAKIMKQKDNNFKSTLFHNTDNLEKQLNKKILHEKDSKSALTMIKAQFDKFFHSELLKLKITMVITTRNESNRSGNKSSRSGNECSKRSNSRNDTKIRPSYDTESMAEGDSNVTPVSSDMSHNRGKVDQRAAKHENERVLLASSTEN